jgi:hypothetical protein
MPIVGQVVTLYFRFLDSTGTPLDITAPEDAPTLYLELNGATVVNDDATLTATGFEQWWEYAYTATASGEVFARAKTTDSDAAGDGTTEPVTFEVSRFGFTGTEGAYKVNSTLGTELDGKIGLISAGNITLSDPLNATTKKLTLTKGDSYEADTPRPLVWESADFATFDIASVAFKYRAVNNASAAVTKAGTALSTTQMRVELTSSETSALEVGSDAYHYDLEATLANGDIVTLARGKITVIADVR